MTPDLSRWLFAAPILLTGICLTALAVLGLHRRIEIGWGLGFGAADVLMGAGFFLAVGWVPFVLLDDPREARIVMMLTYLAFGLLVLGAA